MQYGCGWKARGSNTDGGRQVLDYRSPSWLLVAAGKAKGAEQSKGSYTLPLAPPEHSAYPLNALWEPKTKQRPSLETGILFQPME